MLGHVSSSQKIPRWAAIFAIGPKPHFWGLVEIWELFKIFFFILGWAWALCTVCKMHSLRHFDFNSKSCTSERRIVPDDVRPQVLSNNARLGHNITGTSAPPDFCVYACSVRRLFGAIRILLALFRSGQSSATSISPYVGRKNR